MGNGDTSGGWIQQDVGALLQLGRELGRCSMPAVLPDPFRIFLLSLPSPVLNACSLEAALAVLQVYLSKLFEESQGHLLGFSGHDSQGIVLGIAGEDFEHAWLLASCKPVAVEFVES